MCQADETVKLELWGGGYTGFRVGGTWTGRKAELQSFLKEVVSINVEEQGRATGIAYRIRGKVGEALYE